MIGLCVILILCVWTISVVFDSSQLISSFFKKNICSGHSSLYSRNADVASHSVPILEDQYSDEGPSFQVTTFYRSKDCDILVDSPDTSYLKCIIASDWVSIYNRSSKACKTMPLKNKARLSACTKERVVNVQHQ